MRDQVLHPYKTQLTPFRTSAYTVFRDFHTMFLVLPGR